MTQIVIDVREPDEYAEGHVEGAVNIPLSVLPSSPEELTRIPKDAEVVVYCRSGARASTALNLLSAMGYKRVVNGVNQAAVEAGLGV